MAGLSIGAGTVRVGAIGGGAGYFNNPVYMQTGGSVPVPAGKTAKLTNVDGKIITTYTDTPGYSPWNPQPALGNNPTGLGPGDLKKADPNKPIAITAPTNEYTRSTSDNKTAIAVPPSREAVAASQSAVDSAYTANQNANSQAQATALDRIQEDSMRQRRAYGRASTILTGGSGLLGSPTIARRILLGS